MSRTSLYVRTARGILLALLLASLTAAGCSGYHFGTRALYTSEIKTVFVPIAEADTYRHDLGERLTEAVCKRITDRTPFDLASSQNADSILFIRLKSDNQYISGLDRYNNTRQKNMVWCVSAEWKTRQEETLARLDPIPLTSIGVSVNEMSYLVAEMGQSTATVQQDLIDKIADRVVGLMEEKW
ncbi:MAG: hypothetical protein IKE69_04045 [Thermoguttaceae bacterium]|nr:hypothetical protein [Thermoguttaceae bacterium]